MYMYINQSPHIYIAQYINQIASYSSCPYWGITFGMYLDNVTQAQFLTQEYTHGVADQIVHGRWVSFSRLATDVEEGEEQEMAVMQIARHQQFHFFVKIWRPAKETRSDHSSASNYASIPYTELI